MLPDESLGYALCLALSLGLAHLGAHHHHHHHHYCSSADLLASVRTVNRVVFAFRSKNRSIGCVLSSRVASRCWRAGTAEACSDGSGEPAAARRLSSLKTAGRCGQACPEHRVRRGRRRALQYTFSPEHALALQAVVRVTSPLSLPSPTIASHVVMPFLLLPAANDKLHWHLQWSNPTTQATTSGHLPKHRIRDVHAHLPRSRRSSSLGSQPNLVPEFLSCHAAATLVLVRPSPYLRSLWLEHELRHRTAPLHHYARSSIARYVTPDYVQ